MVRGIARSLSGLVTCARPLSGTTGLQPSLCIRHDLSSTVRHHATTDNQLESTIRRKSIKPPSSHNNELVTIVHRSKGPNNAAATGDFSAPVPKLGALEACSGGRYALPVQRTDYGDWTL